MQLSLCPGSDLMAKGITRNTSVIKIITSALVNGTDDYNIGDSEWPNSCRSDLVLEPKSLSTGLLPPIIIKFQCDTSESLKDSKFINKNQLATASFHPLGFQKHGLSIEHRVN
ncbi:hypothetical protein BDC45DRAFT_532357 [Circinella umbellata]|nr:hypothetical protein BDC45DRAFT_532357 [Circinella umbellata]